MSTLTISILLTILGSRPVGTATTATASTLGFDLSSIGESQVGSTPEKPQDGAKKDAPPPLPPISPSPGAGTPSTETAYNALVPGALPKDTDPNAREAWERTTRSRLTAQAAGTPQRINAFDLQIDVRHRSAGNQTNDSPKPVRYRFLSQPDRPGFVRVTTDNRREHLRGPKGDYLIDADRKEIIRLEAGRENNQDIHQLDESVGIAQNFIALTDPSALRIASLKLLPEPPASLPAALKKRASELALQWLDVRSPDFHLIAPAGRTSTPALALVHVQIGTDPKSGEAEMALVDVDSNQPGLSTSAVLIELARYATIDGFQMPQTIKVYDVDELSTPRAFRVEPTTMLGVITKSASLRPVLKPEDFVPG